jgi:hypothetical protein
MKRLIMYSFFLTLSASVAIANTISTPEEKRIDIERRDTTDSGLQRSIDSSIIEAMWNPDDCTLSLSLYDIGEVDIYIVDSMNRIVIHSRECTSYPLSKDYTINNVNGLVRLIIVSDEFQAEGFFYI